MGFFDCLLGGFQGHSISDVNLCNNYFPNGVQKISMRDGSRTVISGYQAVCAIQRDLGREFGDGFLAVASDLRKNGGISRDLQFLYTAVP
jgi:hypothetical protein